MFYIDDSIGLDQFRTDYPKMVPQPFTDDKIRIKGIFEFTGDFPEHGKISDTFKLLIEVPKKFPRELPVVKEIGGRIPRTGEFHVNPDGSLCLGSRLRLLLKLNDDNNPPLISFADHCLVWYLYAVSKKLNDGGPFIFGELAHGQQGELHDYARLLGLRTFNQVKDTLKLLSMKKRAANKMPCPCGCTQPLGRCKFNNRLHPLRKALDRNFFKDELAYLNSFSKIF